MAPKMPGADFGCREAEALFEVVIKEMRVEPAQLRQLDHGVDRAGLLPIDEGNGAAGLGQNIPVAEIAVTDEADAIAQRPAEPVSPDGIRRRLKPSGEVVKFGQHLPKEKVRTLRPGPRMRRRAGNEGQGFPAGVIKPVPTTRGAPEKPSASRKRNSA